MRRFVFLFIILNLSVFICAQNTSNPFDLSSAIPIEEQVTKTADENLGPMVNKNPFDLESSNPVIDLQEEGNLDSISHSNKNPFDLGVSPGLIQEDEKPLSPPPPPSSLKPAEKPANGQAMGLILFILTLAAIIFVGFRSLYHKIYKAILNDNQLLLLYRERTGRTIGSFFVTYALFFLSSGLFIYLMLIYFKLLPEGNILKQYSIITILLIGLLAAKHLFLSLAAYVFPIKKEIQLYSFNIMISAILLGVLIPFISFIFIYSNEGGKILMLYSSAALALAIYLLSSIRGFFIANRFIFNFPFHFLLYLCAVEIAPVLILYKIVVAIEA